MLYSKKKIEDASDYIADLSSGLPQITETETEKEILNTHITKEELDLKNNKMPGPDGYTVEFLIFFWDGLGYFCYNAILESLDKGRLPDTQLRGIITYLPNQCKAMDGLQNWGPTSLLNTLYKLLSIILTNRLRAVLPRLIHKDQNVFMAGRSITDNTRLMVDIIVMECQEEQGLILLVDYEKAFVSLSWGFISDTMSTYNFGPKFINWIEKGL